MSAPRISVVIPSHQRRELLEKVLSGLAVQSTDAPFEVIVVLDGCTDGSREMLELWRDGNLIADLSWIEQPHSGQAIARNAGVAAARAPIVLLLDDDVVPEIDLLAVHLSHHAAGGRIAVLGDCEVVRPAGAGLHRLNQWRWWEDTYHRRSAPGQPAGFRDFCAGNASLLKEDFQAIEGFDPRFALYGREDYELGYRLLCSGVRFIADRRARGWHHQKATVGSLLRASREEATGDIIMARKHPELIPGLRFAREAKTRLARAAFLAPFAGNAVAQWDRRRLGLYQATSRRRGWDRLFGRLRRHAYWRGVRDALHTRGALQELIGSAGPNREQDIDLAGDVVAQLHSLWIDAPTTLLFRYGAEQVGTLEVPAGLDEPLLDYIVRELQHTMSASLLSLLAREPGWSPSRTPARERA